MRKGNIKKAVKRIIIGLKKLFYPPVCPLCEETLAGGKTRFCENCKPLISYPEEPLCLKCGKETEDDEAEYCRDCRERPKSYVKGFPAMIYKEPLRRSIVKFKYQNKSSYADCFAGEIIRRHGREIMDILPDVLVPVPVHKKKLEKRGYNQAEVLAKSLGKYLDIPVDPGVLKRTENTIPQKLLSDEERQKNLEKAFISDKKQVQYKSVMLVDDIYTTGATVESCTKALKAVGVRKVYYTGICIGRDK